MVFVMQGAGLSGRRAGLIASSVNYVLNVVFTVPAILYIDRWGRRPMLLAGSACMGTFLFLVGGLQGGFGHWGPADSSGGRLWVIEGHDGVTKGVIVCSYFAVCSYVTRLSHPMPISC